MNFYGKIVFIYWGVSTTFFLYIHNIIYGIPEMFFFIIIYLKVHKSELVSHNLGSFYNIIVNIFHLRSYITYLFNKWLLSSFMVFKYFFCNKLFIFFISIIFIHGILYEYSLKTLRTRTGFMIIIKHAHMKFW